ncbi:hypothetical protein PILCRDRAFT_4219 [Piloderma croceum F 1598]|uniref:Uncharacterized protein n=1 Tax=Piloderma croceum (strain F 1598) TaxID=765440 RepID=A0A0C3BKL5_PILCF|nr:hypothetical protein PILCRDRAFT_4219 [Piloderma croceum F 1598]
MANPDPNQSRNHNVNHPRGFYSPFPPHQPSIKDGARVLNTNPNAIFSNPTAYAIPNPKLDPPIGARCPFTHQSTIKSSSTPGLGPALASQRVEAEVLDVGTFCVIKPWVWTWMWMRGPLPERGRSSRFANKINTRPFSHTLLPLFDHK